jgi:peptide chain release factor 2
LQAESQMPDFWQDQENAQKASKRLSDLEAYYGEWKKMRDDVAETVEFGKLALSEDDAEAQASFVKAAEDITARFAKLEFTTLMDGDHDASDAIIAVHAGAGGTEAQDWAEMLLRMLLRYGERKGWDVKMLDESRGAEAGIKSATISVSGRFAYGHLKAEAGVHRLVRISPYDSEKRRHTSFALIEVLPDLGDIAEIEINPNDLRIDTFLSGGNGGQGVQTTYSAVRITHIPTNIVVTCQNERSQTQNKETAMRVLKARLHARVQAERDAEKKKLRGEFTSAEWGSQIRSYVLHPYKMVKDHRTDHQTSDPDAVLDGDLDAFIEAHLRYSKGEKK